jgi:hypothetical protein
VSCGRAANRHDDAVLFGHGRHPLPVQSEVNPALDGCSMVISSQKLTISYIEGAQGVLGVAAAREVMGFFTARAAAQRLPG